MIQSKMLTHIIIEVDVVINIARLYAKQGDSHLAINDFISAIKLKPALTKAHLHLGICIAVQSFNR